MPCDSSFVDTLSSRYFYFPFEQFVHPQSKPSIAEHIGACNDGIEKDVQSRDQGEHFCIESEIALQNGEHHKDPSPRNGSYGEFCQDKIKGENQIVYKCRLCHPKLIENCECENGCGKTIANQMDVHSRWNNRTGQFRISRIFFRS